MHFCMGNHVFATGHLDSPFCMQLMYTVPSTMYHMHIEYMYLVH